MEIFKGWYALLSSSELSRRKPTAFKRFGKDLVGWRDSAGKPVIMEDLCPHRSVKLSLGEIRNDRIVCAFHGFEFGQDGGCLLVPETQKPAPHISCVTLPAREAHGFVWGWNGDSAPIEAEIPWFAELDERFVFSEVKSLWRSHITRCIENQLDYAHLGFVHKSTIGKSIDVACANYQFDLQPDSIIMNMAKVCFRFKFPNIWMLEIVAGKFCQFIAFAPVDDSHTIIYLRTYQSIVTLPLFKELVGLFLNMQANKILNQDKNVVLSHPLVSSTAASHEKLVASDRGIAYFRKIWKQ